MDRAGQRDRPFVAVHSTPDAAVSTTTQTAHALITIATEIPSDAPPLADRERVRRRFALPERFLLSPNGRHLHKNYPLLDRALRILRADGRPVRVVASGLGTDMYNGPDLLGVGYISASELRALYAECEGAALSVY